MMGKLRLAYPTFRQPSKVVLGTGSLGTLAQRGDLSTSLVAISGSPAVRDIVVRTLGRKGIDFDSVRTLVKPAGEPTLDMIRSGAAAIASGGGIETVIAIGGGSVLDWARLAMVEALAQTSGQTSHRPRPCLCLIPTTCATGAEAASVAVYTRNGAKVPVVDDRFLADEVILDGQFLVPLDETTLARSLADALSHGVEAYVSIVPNALAKEAAAAGLRLLLNYGGAPTSPARNERLMEGAYLAGLAASNCSVGVVHAFAHTIASHGFAHGLANAMALEAGIRANAAAPAMQDLANRLGLRNAHALADTVGVLIARAADEADREHLRRLLDSPESRTSIVERMGSDVCLRSNPVRLTTVDLARMLVDVAEGVVRP
jgi:alcohol dehydrogenase class IV